jgi:hypothetical protein
MKPSKNIDIYDFKGNDFQAFIQYLSSLSQIQFNFSVSKGVVGKPNFKLQFVSGYLTI